MKRSTARAGRAPMLRIGYLPLTDAAPLIVAERQGFFARHGLEVRLQREVGWATIREKLAHGDLDAAAALAPMLWAMRLGVGCAPCPVMTGFVLSAHGTALTVARSLGEAAWSAEALREAVRARRGKQPLTFGIVFRFSSHHLLVRNWVRRAGLDPERDVRIVVVPPGQMYRNLAAGTIEGYAAGEPWNSLAVQAGLGVSPTWSAAQPACPIEKVLAVTENFALRRPDEHARLLAALLEAAAWCDEPRHRPALAELLAEPAYIHVPAKTFTPALEGRYDTGRSLVDVPNFHIFHRGGINAPDPAKAAELQAALVSSGLLTASQVSAELPALMFRPAPILNELRS